MKITRIRKLAIVSIDDGYPGDRDCRWAGDICNARVDGLVSTIIIISGIEPASLHKWGEKEFQLVVQ